MISMTRTSSEVQGPNFRRGHSGPDNQYLPVLLGATVTRNGISLFGQFVGDEDLDHDVDDDLEKEKNMRLVAIILVVRIL